MATLALSEVILAVIIGTLAAIVYSLRVLILLERRVAGVEMNISRMTSKILKEEDMILAAVSKKRKVARKPARKKATKRRKR
ncbi:hypothetical protein HOC01_02130 [archaeon]|nr:hypothetical protein [archaeon]MBT6697883.1 hypothetical protein [archaeon]